MFFVNQDYLYGKNKFHAEKPTPHSSSNQMNLPKSVAEHSQPDGAGEGMETAVNAAKAFVGAHAAAAKFAGGAVSKLSKKAVDYAKSDDAKEKMNAAKNKAQALASGAGSAFAGLKGKASAFAAEHKKLSDENVLVSDEYDTVENYAVSSDENIPVSDEYDTEESYAVSSDENIYQSYEENEYSAPDLSAEPIGETQNLTYEEEAPEYISDTPEYKPDTPQYSNPGYIIQKQSISPVFIIVIVALVLVIGILGAMLFMSNKDKKESDSAKNSVSSDVELSENEASETTESTSEEPAAEVTTETTTTVTTAEKAAETTTVPQHIDTIEATKKAMYAHFDEQLQMEQNNGSYFDRDAKYAMYDINGDGIDELFISYLNFESTGSDLYIYKDGEYVKSHSFYSGADICLSEHLLCEKVYGGGEMTKIYVISNNSILQKDEIKELYGTDFYHNDFVISEQEYNNLMSEYNAMNWINVPDNSDYISGLIDISAYDKPKQSVEVHPCNELGVINTHGLGVIGFATSYVVDGSEAKEVRHRLGDWHVKAVKWCYSMDVLWYELYDADDGEYYGWVDADYIDFSQDNNSNDTYTPPKEVNISLNKNTPIEFSQYDGDTLISTVRIDKVEYEAKLSSYSKFNDADADKYYIIFDFLSY